jgi:two-component system response regulator PilR (NtrC family)
VALNGESHLWLQKHPFAGNVRELENLLHRALALCNGPEIVLGDLTGGSFAGPPDVAPHGAPSDTPITTTDATPHDGLPSDLQRHLDDQERDILVRALQETRGNRTAAAARLGLNLRQMRYRIARLGISVGGSVEPSDNEDPLSDAPRA